MTFFSGTDTNTLLSEGQDTVHFVSLIVNNAGEYTAGVTRRVVREIKAEAHIKFTETTHYNSYQDEVVQLADNKVTEKDQEQVKKEEFIEWFNLNIEKEEVENNFEEVDIRIEEIKKIKTRAKSDKQKPWFERSSNITNPAAPFTTNVPYYLRGSELSKPVVSPVPTVNDRVTWSRTAPTPEKNLIKEDAKQLDLFDGTKNESTPLCLLEKADEKLIEKLAGQLLTGDILYDGTTTDINNWVDNFMDKGFEERFGSFNQKDNEERYLDWLEKFVEVIIYEPDEALLDRLALTYGANFDTSDTAEVMAYGLVKYLEDLPDSYCKECIIEELKTYLPDAVITDSESPTVTTK